MHKVPCPRCTNGSGYIRAFNHVLGGVCFKCQGRGFVMRKTKPQPSFRFVAMQDFADGEGFTKTFYFKARTQAEADRKLKKKLTGSGRKFYAQKIESE